VSSGDWFYTYVAGMYCNNVLNGYNTNPPCGSGTPCFKPYNNTTRGQTSKIVVLAFNFPIDTTGGPHFSDVPQGSTFYPYVETARNLGLVGGYPGGTFQPNSNVTRGQLSKIVVGAAVVADPAHWTLLDPPNNTFEDVLPGSTFHQYIETAAAHNILGGYPCGGVGEPCVPPGNKPYFRQFNNATRAQISKIIFSSSTSYGR